MQYCTEAMPFIAMKSSRDINQIEERTSHKQQVLHQQGNQRQEMKFQIYLQW